MSELLLFLLFGLVCGVSGHVFTARRVMAACRRSLEEAGPLVEQMDEAPALGSLYFRLHDEVTVALVGQWVSDRIDAAVEKREAA